MYILSMASIGGKKPPKKRYAYTDTYTGFTVSL